VLEGAPTEELRPVCPHYRYIRDRIQWLRSQASSGGASGSILVSDGVSESGLRKSAEAKETTIAFTASQVFALIAGPSEAEGSAEFSALVNDFTFFHVDDRRDDLDVRVGLGADADQLLEDLVIFGAAIGVAGTVFGNSSDVKSASADGFRPTDTDAEEVCVAKGDVGNGNFACTGVGELIFGDVDAIVGQRGAADGAEMLEFCDQALLNVVEVGDFVEGAAFAQFGALTVGGMKQRDVVWPVALASDSSANAGIHASAEENDRFAAVGHEELNASHRRVPNYFVQLQTEASAEAIFEHPLDKLTRVETGPRAFGIFVDGREQDGVHEILKTVLPGEVAGIFVIVASGDDEFDFVFFGELIEVAEVEGVGLSGIRALDVDDTNHVFRKFTDETLSAGFDHNLVAGSAEMLSQRNRFFLKQGFATGQFDERNTGGFAIRAPVEGFDALKDIFDGHFLAAVEGVGGVAPDTAKIAARESNENAGQPGAGSFSLNGFEDFGDVHKSTVATLLAAGVHLLTGAFGKPVNASEEENHGNHQTRIAWREAHHPKNDDISRSYEKGRNKNNENRAIHGELPQRVQVPG